MMIDAVDAQAPPLPSFAAYNIRFLSLSNSQRDQWTRKLANVKHLVKQYTMTALLETHVDGAKADLFFCRHVEGVSNYYASGFAVLVQQEWASLHRPELHVVVPGAMVAMTWAVEDTKNFIFFMRLDAHSEATRCQQLVQATRWGKDRIGEGDWVGFAGDRNFVYSAEERQSSSRRAWRPSERMNREWNGWLQTIGAQVVPQAEFTWGRVLSNGSDTASWTYEVLDVVGSSIVSSEHGMQAFARRADDVLHPRVSDH